MSNPLKRRFDPIRELNEDERLYTGNDIAPSATMPQPYEQAIWQDYDSMHDIPRQSQYHGPSYINPLRYGDSKMPYSKWGLLNKFSDIPILQPMNSMEDLFDGMLLDPTGEQISTSNTYINEHSYSVDGALLEWGNEIVLSDTDYPGSAQFSSQETSQLSSLSPDSSQSRSDDIIMLNDQDEICYGMLHNVDVKLIGEMQAIHSRLGKRETMYERFKIKKKEDHIVLSFHDADDDDEGGEFGYLRSAVGRTLASLLAMPNVKFEPIGQASSLKDIIGRANKASEAIAKVDINLYGPQGAAKEVGNTLSHGKLWLQKSAHMKGGITYDNPHFLRLEISGVPIQCKQPVSQTRNERRTGKQEREERLQKMVEEVYKSLDRTRDLDRVDGGDRVTQELLKHQEEALGFMLERESGHITDKYRLWETKILDDGTEEYHHRITKRRIKNGIQPDERGGGILADEMGMGKSLSILALIMKTLDDGKSWAEQQQNSTAGGEEVQRSRSTLVIVPSALLVYNWINEIKTHLKKGVKKIKYHGSDRPTKLSDVLDSDIVVTTYSTLKAEFQNKSAKSLLHCIDWYRIVLDEAHIIRRRATLFYRSCDELHANSRWCLTGTPIQNRLADIGTLFAFIRADPFSKASVFRKWIEVPFEQSTDDSTTIAIKDRLVMLIEALCLRRTKDVIKLPEMRSCFRELEFTPEEREQYENTKKILMRMICHRVGEVDKSSHFGLFQMNLQMRLLCNHGTYQQPFSWRRRSYQDEREAAISALGQNSEISCSGCQSPMPILGSSWLRSDYNKRCNHVLCSECIEQSGSLAGCPVCLLTLGSDMMGNNASANSEDVPDWPAKDKLGNNDDHYFHREGHSTKMKALIEDVEKDLNETKSIIFSCWTRTLKLLSRYLEEAGIKYLCIDGSCSLSQRQAKLDQFANDDEKRVLIMTTGTGGFGLNLTCANRIFIVELQWNPGVESQAIARAIRLGQKSEVKVTRYLIKGTVEEEMRSQQRYKKQLAALGFDELPDADADDH
ncbi:SNF2 family N-terminal domain-containing protein [Trichoderma evansii]